MAARTPLILAALSALAGTVGPSCGGECGGWSEYDVDSRLLVLSADGLVAVGREGTILRPPHPELVPSSTAEDLLAVSDDLTGASHTTRIAVGRRGTIRISDDDEVWRAPAAVPAIDADLHGVWTTDGLDPYKQQAVDLGLAVGAGGTILISDGSMFETWTAAPSPTKRTLRAVAGQAQGRLLAVGEFGTVIYSDDRGATWTGSDAGTQEDLLALVPLDTRFYVVGTSGTVLTGDGNSWTPVSLDTTETLHEVRIIPPPPTRPGASVLAIGETTAYRIGARDEPEYEFEDGLLSIANKADRNPYESSPSVLVFLLKRGGFRSYSPPRKCLSAGVWGDP